MKRTKVLCSALLALSLVAVAGCNKSGGKKKTINDAVWEYGFSGCVLIGASGSVVAGVEGQVMPSRASSSFVTLSNERIAADPETGEQDTFTFTYEYSASAKYDNVTQDKPAEDYIASETVSPDGKSKTLNFKNWPSQAAQPDQYPRFKIKATAKSSSGETREKNYILVLNPNDKVFYEKSLDDLFEMAGSKLAWTKDKLDTGGSPIAGAYAADFSQVGGQDRYWIKTWGYLTYVTADCNWGLLQNGDKTIQIYRLDGNSEFKANPGNFKNKPVEVQCDVSFGFGNIQMAEVQKISVISDSDSHLKTVTPAAAYTKEMMASNWKDQQLFNQIVTNVNVTFKGNIYSIVNKSGEDTTRTAVTDRSKITSSSVRYEFDVELGGQTFIVATDYHSVKDSTAFTTKVDNLLKTTAVDATISLGGTIRWMNDRTKVNKNDYSIREEGQWTLTPFTAEHIG